MKLQRVRGGHPKSAGIDAILSKDDAGGMLPSLQEAEGVSLLVRPEDTRRARVILHDNYHLRNQIP